MFQSTLDYFLVMPYTFIHLTITLSQPISMYVTVMNFSAFNPVLAVFLECMHNSPLKNLWCHSHFPTMLCIVLAKAKGLKAEKFMMVTYILILSNGREIRSDCEANEIVYGIPNKESITM